MSAGKQNPTGGSDNAAHAKPGKPITVVHVTHEAVDHIGGIGTVLAGLMTSTSYRAAVRRSILVGPLPWPDSRVSDPVKRLGSHGVECWYSGPDHHDPRGLGAVLKPVEWAFGVRIVYGTRRFDPPGGVGRAASATAEVLLIDVTNPQPERLGAFKWMLHEQFGLDSRRYEHNWDYEEYTRLAEPAYHALCALLGDEELPAMLIGHEYMGLPAAFRASLDRQRFRTAFHAHECSTARRITESIAGHDAAFYPAMRAGRARGMFAEDIFGDQSDSARHALVSRSHRLDVILAVGDPTAEELRFLNPKMNAAPVKVAYNGVPAASVSMSDRRRSRDLVNQWIKNVIGFVPDYLFTHVTRPVSSKGLWRDQKVVAHLEPMLRASGKSAAYVLLTCGAPVRTHEQVDRMAREYNWPASHREGFPDLVGLEASLYHSLAAFTKHAHVPGGRTAHRQPGGGVMTIAPPQESPRSTVTPILVNQFGFSRERLGSAAEAMSVDDLRRAADVEFGLSTYEPFGIAQLEPLHAGGICLPSSVCGCLGLVERAMRKLGLTPEQCPVVLSGDFTHWAHGGDESDLHRLTRLSSHERDALEEKICKSLATELAKRLPTSEADTERYLKMGQSLASRMSWDRVVETDIMPALMEALARAS